MTPPTWFLPTVRVAIAKSIEVRLLKAELAEIRASVKFTNFQELRMEVSCLRAAVDLLRDQIDAERACSSALRSQLSAVLDVRAGFAE